MPLITTAATTPDACFPKPSAVWCNTSLSFAERARALVSVMTLADKAQQLSTFTPKTVPGIGRIGLPPYSYHSEGLHGLRNSFDTVGLNATLFPQTTALAASGNMTLVHAVGSVMLTEARALNNYAEKRKLGPFGRGAGLFYWSPTMNLGRDPRWGRFQESISEDPLLNGLYSASMLQGFQGNDSKYLGVAATCKHLLAYSVEGGVAGSNVTRHNFDAKVSPRDLHETYVPAFRQCIVNGKPAQIMCAYNAINGVPACLRGDLQNGLARGRWGFDGLIVSDQDSILDAWNGTKKHPGHYYGGSQANASAIALRAGCDQNDGTTYMTSLPDAVSQKLVSEADLDVALTRVMVQRFRVGAFDPPSLLPWSSLTPSDVDSAPHRQLALQAAREGVVLLANRNGALPLTIATAPSIAVIGPLAHNPTSLLGGKPDYHPSFITTHLDGIRKLMKSEYGAAPTFAAGCESLTKCSSASIAPAEKLASSAAVTLIFVGIDGSLEHEGADRTTIGLPAPQLAMLKAVAAASAASAAGKKVVVVLCNGGPLSVDWLSPLPQSVDAIVEAFELGQSAGTALAEMLFGHFSPSGVLPFSILPESYVAEQRMEDMDMRAGPGRTYRFYRHTPLWPFGFALSYATFSITLHGPSTIHVTTHAAARGLAFDVSIANTASSPSSSSSSSKMASAAGKVVMAFLSTSEIQGDDHPPRLSMWAMRKVHLGAGQGTSIRLATNESGWCALCTVDDAGVRAIRAGRYHLRFGGDGGVRPPGSCDSSSTGDQEHPCAEAELVVTGDTVPQPW